MSNPEEKCSIPGCPCNEEGFLNGICDECYWTLRECVALGEIKSWKQLEDVETVEIKKRRRDAIKRFLTKYGLEVK